MNLTKIFNQLQPVIGIIASDVNFDIYRPDYTAVDQLGTLIASNKSVRFDTRAGQWAEPNVSEGQFYDLFLNRKIVQPGDVLIPTGLSPTASTMSDYPIITIGSMSGLKPCVGVLTDRRGDVYNSSNNLVISNARWQWTSVGNPRSGPNRQPSEDVLQYDRRDACMFKRPGLMIAKGMTMVERFGSQSLKWRILDVTQKGNYFEMQLVQEAR